ncbi:MAG TPA: hypothetical protein VH684_21300 [Xanthobacteraceae bacterium]|jgi:hypothetical protein
METYHAIRKQRVAPFAEVIAFPGKSDLNQRFRKLADHIEQVAKVDPALRDAPARKPQKEPKPVRRRPANERRRSRAAPVAFTLVFALVALLSTAAGWALSEYYLDAEQRGFDDRANELAHYALSPGSPLACLSGYAGEMVESSCEKALFATPQAAAIAVSYVNAELSLLADADINLSRNNIGYGPALSRLRHVIELDRFGIAAHILLLRDGCTPDRCRAFSLLQDSHKIRANLSERTYENYVARHFERWQTADASRSSGLSSGETVVEARPSTTDANRPIGPRLKLPSASIPPISIMEPESPPSTPSPPRKR